MYFDGFKAKKSRQIKCSVHENDQKMTLHYERAMG